MNLVRWSIFFRNVALGVFALIAIEQLFPGLPAWATWPLSMAVAFAACLIPPHISRRLP